MNALKVTEHADTKAKDLSGGTKRKVSFQTYRLFFWVGFGFCSIMSIRFFSIQFSSIHSNSFNPARLGLLYIQFNFKSFRTSRPDRFNSIHLSFSSFQFIFVQPTSFRFSLSPNQRVHVFNTRISAYKGPVFVSIST